MNESNRLFEQRSSIPVRIFKFMFVMVYVVYTRRQRDRVILTRLCTGVGTQFQNDHEYVRLDCEPRGMHFSLELARVRSTRVPNICIIQLHDATEERFKRFQTSRINPSRCQTLRTVHFEILSLAASTELNYNILSFRRRG